LAIDKEYNYNPSVYESNNGLNFVNLFSDGNLPKHISSDVLSMGIMRGFRGKWGTTTQNERKGVIQPLARISYLDSMSHIRRVTLDFTLKSPGPRHLHTSQCGYFCISEVPSGFNIGITKNASIFTIFSLSENTRTMTEWLYAKGGVTSVDKSNTYRRQHFCRVQMNGGTIGFIQNPEQLVRVLKLFKRTNCMSPTTSISFNRPSRTVRIYMDEGRPCRPLWVLSKGALAPIMGATPQEKMALLGWRGLVCGNLTEMRGRDFYTTGFTDPYPAIVDMAGYIERIEPYAGAIEYIDPYEQNESFISWWGANDLSKENTHCELHPSSMFGFVGSMIPFANHNQSPRNQLSCSQSKQGIGFYSTQFHNRFDTYATQLCYGEAPLSRTLYYDLIADGNMAYGVNCIVALASFDGYNMDDGILFNKSSVERGLFQHLSYRTYDGLEERDPESQLLIRIGNPNKITNWMSLKPGVDYSKLDEDGIIREGEFIDSSTVLVGRYMVFEDSNQIKDASITPTVFTQGRVEKVTVIHQANGGRLVHIRVFELRVPELGDKFSTRHGQKGTIGMLRPAYDLPRTKEGVIPDILVNPHCIPSRMTVAQIMEMITGKVGAYYGSKMNSTSFTNDERHHELMGKALEEANFDKNGEEVMYSPFTGKQYQSTIFSCPLYFMRLRHLTTDKINARGVGRKEIRTHQPTGGRGNEGGLRIGEMERDVLIGHGISEMLHERMMKCSDETTFVICNSCGQMPIYNEQENIYICPSCDGPIKFVGNSIETIEMVQPITRSRTTFSRVRMPYAYKLLNQELATYMNLGMRFVNATIAERLRDETLDWGAVAEAGDGKIELTPLPSFSPPELASSTAKDGSGPDVVDLQVNVEKEPGVEPLPPNPLLEAERKRADEAESALAEQEAQGQQEVRIQLPGNDEIAEGGGGGGAGAGEGLALRQRGGASLMRGSQPQNLIFVMPQTGGANRVGRPATGRQPGYEPKRKGVAIGRMYENQQGGGDGAVVPQLPKQQGGAVQITVQKEGRDEEEE
jgi:DNA-directed RNA polymerase beta subunit